MQERESGNETVGSRFRFLIGSAEVMRNRLIVFLFAVVIESARRFKPLLDNGEFTIRLGYLDDGFVAPVGDHVFLRRQINQDQSRQGKNNDNHEP